MNELKTELQKLYSDASKHSVYQHVPEFVSAELGYAETIDEGWRGDRNRLSYLLANQSPRAGETWLDFGANTGFFTLSLAHDFPETAFVAVEANPNHARFIERVAHYFGMRNVEVIQRAVGLRELPTLPRATFLLHLNVLHHAGHDFDTDLVPNRDGFTAYAENYLRALHQVADAMLFQMGSNWGGDKQQPLIGTRDDASKLRLFAALLSKAGWHPEAAAYPHPDAIGSIGYVDIDADELLRAVTDALPVTGERSWAFLDQFPGEFYRRPLLRCSRR